MKLPNKQLIELKNILKDTPFANPAELQLLKMNAPGVYYSKTAFDENAFEVSKYTLKYKKLNDFLFNITNWDEKHMSSIHHIHYTKGSKAREHVDYSDLTCVIMLENDSEGGQFLFNKELMEFKNPGEYLIYKGSTLHEVKELISGYRDVLVVWYRKDVYNTKSII